MGHRKHGALSGALAIAILGSAGPALADEVVNEVTVTGTRIPRAGIVGVAPITSVSEELFDQSGFNSLADYLQTLPSVTGGDLGPRINIGGSEGTATVSLRGLGPNRTLVLINGQRPVYHGVDGIVDMTLLPAALVDRVEVLRDAGSTIYGSDAVAGVINIITKREFKGLELNAQYDITDESDGQTWTASLLGGRSWDRGGLVVGMQFQDREEIWQDDRRFSACPFADGDGAVICEGSLFTDPALFIGGPDFDLFLIRDRLTGEVRDFGLDDNDAYNFAPASYLSTPQETWTAHAGGWYDLVPAGGFSSVTARLDVSYGRRDSDQFVAPEATFWIPPVAAAHPDNPFGDLLCAEHAAVGCVDPQEVYIARRLTETGGRQSLQEAEIWQVIAGLEGVFSNGWTWNLSYNRAEYDDRLVETNRARNLRLDATLDPDLCAADPECPGLWNPFLSGTLTPELQAYALADAVEDVSSELEVFQANITGDISAFSLPGGNIRWAAGVEHRSEEAASVPDPLALAGEIYFFPTSITRGDYDVTEAYGELRLPILSGVRGAELLAVDASLRWSDYDFLSSSETSTRIGIEWAPVRDLRLRASYSEAFRAPNISELFRQAYLTAEAYMDPCTDYGSSTNPDLVANCQSEGLPPDWAGGPQGQAVARAQGNGDLKPEEADTLTIGLALTPAFLPDLVVTLDWFRIEIDDAIGSPGTANIIDACWASPDFSSPLCALVAGPSLVDETPDPTSPYRNALGDISGIDLTEGNFQSYTTSGVDFSASYRFELRPGTLDVRLQGTWLDTYEFRPAAGAPLFDYAGHFGPDPFFGFKAAFPEWQATLQLAFRRDGWGASWNGRFLDGVSDLEPTPGALDSSTPSVIYHDVQGFVELGPVTLTGGIRNLFDREPPYVSDYDDMNTLPASYDTAGRYYYARAQVRF